MQLQEISPAVSWNNRDDVGKNAIHFNSHIFAAVAVVHVVVKAPEYYSPSGSPYREKLYLKPKPRAVLKTESTVFLIQIDLGR